MVGFLQKVVLKVRLTKPRSFRNVVKPFCDVTAVPLSLVTADEVDVLQVEAVFLLHVGRQPDAVVAQPLVAAENGGGVTVEAHGVGERRRQVDPREHLVPGRREGDADADVVLGGTAVPLVLAGAVAVALQGAKPSALNRFAPLLTLDQCDHCSSASHVAESNTGVFGDRAERVDQRRARCRRAGPWYRPAPGSPGATPSTWAVQRRVVARRDFGADADAADVLGQAHAEQVDVVGVDQVVLAGAGPTRVSSVCGSLSAKLR